MWFFRYLMYFPLCACYFSHCFCIPLVAMRQLLAQYGSGGACDGDFCLHSVHCYIRSGYSSPVLIRNPIAGGLVRDHMRCAETSGVSIYSLHFSASLLRVPRWRV